MLLAIDVGNSHMVVGLMDGKQIQLTFRLSTHPYPTSDELIAKLSMLLHHRGIEWGCWQQVAISSVVPHLNPVLARAFSDVETFFIDHHAKYSFRIGARPPEQVGADRLVNAEAAVREFGSPVFILDSGTATTLCAVDSEGTYLGGAIMPGMELSTKALASNAAKLFAVELTAPPRVIGSNTDEALRSGLVLGYASMIDGLIERFSVELALPNPKVVATGGVGPQLAKLLKTPVFVDPDLTLKGIAYVAASSRA
jgi:type III pantothenate kinase